MQSHSSIVRAGLIATLLVGCGGGGTGGDGDAGDPAIARGAMVASSGACAACHGADYSGGTVAMGGVIPPNITPDGTHGIGDWTDAQIIAAVRVGIDPDGGNLCPTMPRLASLSEAQAMDLVTYLRSLAPSENDVAEGTCAPPAP